MDCELADESGGVVRPRFAPGYVSVWLLGASLAAAGLSCWRPSQPRARRDASVGSAATSLSQGDEVSVVVSEGHAVIRELTDSRLSLWASAPRLEIQLNRPDAATDWQVVVSNCMPDSQLTSSHTGITIESLGRSAEGQCEFQLSADPGRWTLVLAPPDTERAQPFRFAVLSDVQEAIDEVQDIFSLINQQPGVEFVLGAGDLTQRGTDEQLTRFQYEMRALNVPYYTTLGNHELGETPSLFHDYFGRGNSSFEYRTVRFTLLDSASATLDPLVYDWLKGWLSQGAESAHVVAMHIPPLDPIGVRNGAFASRNEAAKLLGRLAAGKVDMTFYGHIHSYYQFDNAGIPAHISGGGGAIPERFDNIGRHFLVVEAFPESQRFDVRVVRVD